MSVLSVNCPNCRNTLTADVQQLFDVNQEPDSKQVLLSGNFNQINCPHCGFSGQIPLPIVYHDSEKELLLTFTPPEANLARDVQERALGSMINTVTNRLSAEQRKGYLLQPKVSLTMQGMLELILEADGITKEMIEGQQKRIRLIQELSLIEDEKAFETKVKTEEDLIDAEFFAILQQLARVTQSGGDTEASVGFLELQSKLLPMTESGRKIQEQSREIESVIKELQELGEDITREDLLELVLSSDSESRLRLLVSLARPAFDYQFLLLLSERIDRARGEGRTRLVDLRTKIQEIIAEIDQQMEIHQNEVKKLLDEIVAAADVKEIMSKNLNLVDEFFIQEMRTRREKARAEGELDLIEKYNQIEQVILEASSASQDVLLIEELLKHDDPAERHQILEQNADRITPEFISLLSNLVIQTQSEQDSDVKEKISELNREVLKFSMEKRLSET
jgi:hypothetical protein